MANYFAQLQPFQVNANPINLAPVNNALDTITQQQNIQRQFGLQQQASDRADQELALNKQTTASALKTQAANYEDLTHRILASTAQGALSLQDPNARSAIANGIVAGHPEMATNLTQYGVDPKNPDGVLNFFANYGQNPLDRQVKQAQIAGLNSENALRGKSFTTTGHDAYGQPTYGMVDLTKPNGGIPAPASGQGPTNTLTPNGQGISGADYLATLPKPMADQVKAIAEGRVAFPSGFALKTPYWQQMITRVSQYDPSFDAINYNSRSKTRNDFTSGKSAQNITSFNTAIGHLGTLADAIDSLNNSDLPPVNSATNASVALGNADRGAKLNAFNAAKDAVSKEMVKAFRGSGGSLTEIQGFENLFDAAQSPKALHAAVNQAIDLLNSRVQAVGDQYNRGMGTTADPITLLSPKAQDTLKRIAPDLFAAPSSTQPKGADPATAPAPSGTPLAAPKTQADYNALPSGTRYTDPNGTPRVKP